MYYGGDAINKQDPLNSRLLRVHKLCVSILFIHSPLSTVNRLKMNGQVSIHCREGFFPSLQSPDWLWGPHGLLPTGYRRPFPGVKCSDY